MHVSALALQCLLFCRDTVNVQNSVVGSILVFVRTVVGKQAVHPLSRLLSAWMRAIIVGIIWFISPKISAMTAMDADTPAML